MPPRGGNGEKASVTNTGVGTNLFPAIYLQLIAYSCNRPWAKFPATFLFAEILLGFVRKPVLHKGDKGHGHIHRNILCAIYFYNDHSWHHIGRWQRQYRAI